MSDVVQKKIWVIQRNWLYNKMSHDYDYNPRNSVTNLLYDFNNETISTMAANFHPWLELISFNFSPKWKCYFKCSPYLYGIVVIMFMS